MAVQVFPMIISMALALLDLIKHNMNIIAIKSYKNINFINEAL